MGSGDYPYVNLELSQEIGQLAIRTIRGSVDPIFAIHVSQDIKLFLLGFALTHSAAKFAEHGPQLG